jgi:hypothetical protein
MYTAGKSPGIPSSAKEKSNLKNQTLVSVAIPETALRQERLKSTDYMHEKIIGCSRNVKE